MGKQSRLLEILPNFLLFFLFACCMFTVLLTGVKIYRNVSSVMEEQFSVTTCASYLSAKVRHYDVPDGVSVETFGETDCLIFREEINDEAYVTYLYCKDGSLMELFCAADLDVLPEDGESIMPLDELQICKNGRLISFICELDGEKAEGSIALQCGEGRGQ